MDRTRLLHGRSSHASKTALMTRHRHKSVMMVVQELEPRLLLSVTIQLNYSLDTSGFFNNQAARDTLTAAANEIASRLTDSLQAIQPSGGNTWSETFFNPSTGLQQTINNPTVAANTLVIYVGARPLGNTEAGIGGPGGSSESGSQAWVDTVAARGQTGALAAVPTDFGPWGGSISFDNSAQTHWYFGTDASGLAANQLDFFTVAEHEIGHVLGIGLSPSWQTFVSGNNFVGPASEAAFGGTPVPLQPGGGHWAQGTMSDGQVAIMTPVIALGQRRLFTTLDFAGLSDIGWNVQSISTFQFQQATKSTSENAGTVNVVVTRTGGNGPVTVGYATGGGTAKPGVDYTSVSGTLQFAAGQTAATIAVPLLNNPNASGNLTFNVVLSNPGTSATLGSPSTAIVTINPATTATQTTLTSSANPSVVGQPITLTAKVATVPSGLPDPGGSVTFKDGTTVLGTSTLNSGIATLTVSTLGLGTHSITASYNGNGNLQGSSSTALSLKIGSHVAPTLAAIPNATVNEGSLFTFVAQGSEPGSGTTLSYSLGAGAPAGASINSSTGVFSFTPSAAPASFSITIKVQDNNTSPLSASRTFTINVANVSPVVVLGGNAIASLKAPFIRGGSFIDPGSGAETWTATVDYGDGTGSQPLSLSGKTFVLRHTYSVSGSYTPLVTVRDSNGGVGTASFRVQVEAPSDFNGDGVSDIGLYLPTQDLFALDDLKPGGGSVGQSVFTYGYHTGGVYSVPLVGDFDGNGNADIGLYFPSLDLFALNDLNAAGKSIGQSIFSYGYHTGGVYSVPLVGDFNDDGTTDVGIYLPTQDIFALDFLNHQGQSIGQAVFSYGYHTGGVYSVPLVGDFNGDGNTDVGIYLPALDQFALNDLNPQGQSIGQSIFTYGFHTGGVYSVPLVGDFNRDGTTDVGIYVPTQDFFALDNLGVNGQSIGQNVFTYGFHDGGTFAVPIVGDFNGDGTTDVGVYLPNHDLFALDYLNTRTGSVGQSVFSYGAHVGGVNSVPLPSLGGSSASFVQGQSVSATAVANTSPLVVSTSPPAAAPSTPTTVASTRSSARRFRLYDEALSAVAGKRGLLTHLHITKSRVASIMPSRFRDFL